MISEVAPGLSSEEARSMQIVVELLIEQRAQIERLWRLWGLARGLLATAGLADATGPDD